MDIQTFFIFRSELLMFEFLFFSLPYFAKKERKKLFWITFPTTIIIYFLVGVGFAVISQYQEAQVNYARDFSTAYNIVQYILFYLLFVLGSKINFKGSIYEIISCTTQALVLRQICYCFYILLITFIGDNYNFLTLESVNFINGLLYVFTHVFAAAIYCFFARKLLFKSTNTLSKSMLLIYIIASVALINIHSVAEVYSTEDYSLYFKLLICSEIVSLIILVSTDLLIRYTNRLKEENSIVLHLLDEQGNQFKFSKANSEDLRIKAHNLKHQVKILREGGPEAEKLLDELQDSINDYESTMYLDNNVLGIILRDKYSYCKKHNIKLSYISDPNAFLNVSKVDLYTLIGNILDNAIEASLKLKNKNQRVISVNISSKNGISSIRCDNYYEGKLEIENGIYKTNKLDASNHGYGIMSIDMLAKKYGGFVDIQTENQIFVLRVNVPEAE